MRAYQLSTYGGPQALTLIETGTPVPGADQVLVEVAAIGVNFPDLLFTRGLYQHRPELPVVPGCEIAGVVLDAPAGSGLVAGDRVAGFTWDGGFAERVAIPAGQVVPVAADVPLESAAAGLVNNHTAYFALGRRGQLRHGETVLVLGAAGGVGTAAIQVARGMGARVIAGVSRPERIGIARQAGAEEVIVLGESFSDAVKDLTGGRGADVVVDPVGDWLTTEALRALAPEGRLLVIGFAAGGIPVIKANRLLLRNIGVLGAAWGGFLGEDPSLVSTAAAELDRMTSEGFIAPPVESRYIFEDLPRALEDLASGAIAGKAVVLVDPVR